MGIGRSRLWDRILGRSGPPVIVVFVAADDAASVTMADQVGRRKPSVGRIVASWDRIEERRFRGVSEFVSLDAKRPCRSLLGFRWSMRRRRVQLVVFRQTPQAPLSRRWLAVVLWRQLWVFNEDGENHLVDWSHPVTSWRFLRGWPADDLQRPTRLGFLREWAARTRTLALWIGSRLHRKRGPSPYPSERAPVGEGCTVASVPEADLAQVDQLVAGSDAAEVVVTLEAIMPDNATVAALRKYLEQPDVWLVWARSSFKQVLGDGLELHRRGESGTFCLAAGSSLFALRRDVFLQLGGLAYWERQLPGQGWSALSLQAWLHGYKAVYAGDVEFRGIRPATQGGRGVEGHPLAALLAVCDEPFTAARLLHNEVRTADAREEYRQAVRRVRLPVIQGKRQARLTPLAEPGAAILRGRERGHSFRLGVLATELPSPVANRAAAQTHNLLRRLSSECDIFLFAYADRFTESQTESLLDYCARLVIVQPREPAPSLFQRLPPATRRYQAISMRRHLEVLLEDWNIPILQIEGSDLAMAASWIKPRSTSRVLSAPGLRYLLAEQVRRSRFGRLARVGGGDGSRWRRYELPHLRRCDLVVTASDADRKRLAKKVSPAVLRTVEGGVDAAHFQTNQPPQDGTRVLWIGELDDWADTASFQCLLYQIWPRIRAACPQASLTVVAGDQYRKHWRRRFSSGFPELPPEVTVLGEMGDLRSVYERSAVFVAPLPASNGCSPRVLEAFSMGRAVVASPEACEGMDVSPGEDLLLAEDPPRFAAQVIRLLKDPEMQLQLGRSGRNRVTRRYEWNRATEAQLAIYEELLRKRF